MEGLAVGRTVHYVLEDGNRGDVRPAVVVRIWDHGGPQGTCNLQVFTDGRNDGEQYASGIAWKTSRCYDPDGAPGTWHWPPRV